MIDAINGVEPAYQVVGMLDDDAVKWGTSPLGPPVLGPLAQALQVGAARFVNTLGSPRYYWRLPEIVQALGIPHDRFVALTHPAAWVSRRATVGAGALIFANASVGAYANIGLLAQVLANGVVSHNVSIGACSIVAGGATLAGGVRVGRACYLGAGCAIRQGVSIGDGALVGMGAVVLRDVAPNSVVVGNPARLLRVRA